MEKELDSEQIKMEENNNNNNNNNSINNSNGIKDSSNNNNQNGAIKKSNLSQPNQQKISKQKKKLQWKEEVDIVVVENLKEYNMQSNDFEKSACRCNVFQSSFFVTCSA
ncbi:hypothetical protein ABPG74_016389 [Tetrahymena malaccensis]